MINKLLHAALLVLLAVPVTAQKKNKPATPETLVIPLNAENWTFQASKVEFAEHKSRPSIKLLANSGPVVLKNMDFSDGIIELDIDPVDPAFSNMYFRWKDENESECFYFRTSASGNTTADYAVQYAPIMRGVNLWDLLGYYQGNADFRKGEWNHVKLVISGRQMRVYVNNMSKPTMQIPRLEGDITHGTLAFSGQSIISNLIVRPGQVEGLLPGEGIDPTEHDPRLVRDWQVSQPVVIPPNIDFSYDLIPTKDTKWDSITAERRGLINLTRKFGSIQGRRIVWLKKTINSPVAQRKKVNLGFSDEVWVMINGRLLFVDKNWYAHPIRKEPAGRISLENSSFMLPLQAGDNELLIGVANDFYGWGILASLNMGSD